MSRPLPTPVMHFTHADNLAMIVANGVVSDTLASRDGSTQVDVGQQSIKDIRRRRAIDVPPGGVVADYPGFRSWWADDHAGSGG